jgi:hypothetical protein
MPDSRKLLQDFDPGEAALDADTLKLSGMGELKVNVNTCVLNARHFAILAATLLSSVARRAERQ